MAASPPLNGVSRALSAACAAASASSVSSPPPTRGVRTGMLPATEGVCSYWFMSMRVESDPPSSIIAVCPQEGANMG